MIYIKFILLILFLIVSIQSHATKINCEIGVKENSLKSVETFAPNESGSYGAGIIAGKSRYKVFCTDHQTGKIFSIESIGANKGFMLGLMLEVSKFTLFCNVEPNDITGDYSSVAFSTGTGISIRAGIMEQNGEKHCKYVDLAFGVGSYLTVGKNKITEVQLNEVIYEKKLSKCYRQFFSEGPYKNQYYDIVASSLESENVEILEALSTYRLEATSNFVVSYPNGYCPLGAQRRKVLNLNN